jgi:signal peptidase I
MLPTIQDGDILHVATVSPAKLKAGDIVLFKDGDKFKAHRIIRRRKGGFVTRGDAGIDADGEIAARQILGKVVGKESGGKRVIVLDNAGNRVRFFARELRRSLSRLRHRF